MKKIIIGIAGFLLLTTAFVVSAAPTYRVERTIVPEADNTYDLGSNSLKWKNLYVNSCTGCGSGGGGGVGWATTTTSNESIYFYGKGNVGIGTSSPYAKLSVAGPIIGQNFVATSTTATSTFAGNVGIGTTLPLSKLHVIGDPILADTASYSTSENIPTGAGYDDDGSCWDFNLWAYKTVSGVKEFSPSGTFSELCDSSGSGTTFFTIDHSWSSVTNKDGYVIERTNDGSFYDVGNTTSFSDDNTVWGAESYDTSVKYAPVAAIFTNSNLSAKVGINNTNPQYNLDVVGTAKISSTLTVPTITSPSGTLFLPASVNLTGSRATLTGGAYFESFLGSSWLNFPTSGPWGIGFGGAGNNLAIGYSQANGHFFANALSGDIDYRNTGGRLLWGNTPLNSGMILQSNRLGVGTTSPWAELSVSTSTTAAPNAGLFAVASSSNATLFTVLGGGNVGIGTTTPFKTFSITASGTATTTFVHGTATNPSCNQYYSPNGTVYRTYMSNAGVLTTEAGTCQ